MRLWLLLPLIGISICCSAAPFQNLGFDEGNTNTVDFPFPSGMGEPPFGFGPIEDLLPSWMLYDGNTKFTRLGYNLEEISDTTSLITTNNGYFPIEGPYALRLGGRADLSMVQTGDIPSNARFLRYDFSGIPFSVTINGVTLPHNFGFLSPPNYRTNAVFDVSEFAGQNVELKFKLVNLGPMGYGNTGFLDSLTFVVGDLPPVLHVRQGQTNMIVTWSGDTSMLLGTSPSVVGPWDSITNASSPYVVPKDSAKMMLFRLSGPPATNPQ